MQGAANKVADYVPVADENVHLFIRFVGRGAMDVTPKACFYAATLLEVSLPK